MIEQLKELLLRPRHVCDTKSACSCRFSRIVKKLNTRHKFSAGFDFYDLDIFRFVTFGDERILKDVFECNRNTWNDLSELNPYCYRMLITKAFDCNGQLWHQ